MQPKLTANLDIVGTSNLEITLLDGDLNIIQKLDDEPNDVGGLTSAELKAKFDEAGNTIKTYINETLIPEILTEATVEEARKDAENARQSAETARINAESARVDKEEARAAAETTRQTQEGSRQKAEDSRNASETARANAETARAAAEAARTNEEAARERSESARTSAENSRGSAEAIRSSSESTRQAQENARQNAESARASAEAARVNAENARATSEKARCVWEDYNAETSYIPGNKVVYLGSSYVNIAGCLNVLPTNPTYWQMIASKGVDGQGAGDMKAQIYDPDNAVSAAGGIVAYVSEQTTPPSVTILFSADQWTGDAAPFILTIPAGAHKRRSGDFLFDVWALSGGIYCKNTWAVQELGMEYTAATGDFSLHSDTKFDGKVIFAG